MGYSRAATAEQAGIKYIETRSGVSRSIHKIRTTYTQLRTQACSKPPTAATTGLSCRGRRDREAHPYLRLIRKTQPQSMPEPTRGWRKVLMAVKRGRRRTRDSRPTIWI